MARTKDAIIIGAGQAGPFLAARLAEAGWKVALIERGASRRHLRQRRLHAHQDTDRGRPRRLGRPVQRRVRRDDRSRSVDMRAVKARKDTVVGNAVKGLEDWLGGMPNVEIIRDSARFVGPHEVAVGDDRLTADHIFINTGARPLIPDWPGLTSVPYLTNRSMMDLDVLPEHLLVVGGSYVGLEFAQMYRRFGSRVTVLQRGERLLTPEDEDIAVAIQDILVAEGIDVRARRARHSVVEAGGRHRPQLRGRSERQRSMRGSHLLIATGRVPNVEDLDLGAAGVALDDGGYIAVDDRLETNVPGVFALGDVNGKGAFTHTSYNDFEIVADNILSGTDRKVTDRIPASALYTDPPLGRAGKSETEVRKSGEKALIATLPMTRVQRAKERGETGGFFKLPGSAETATHARRIRSSASRATRWCTRCST